MTIRQAMFSARHALQEAGVPDPAQDAELLVSHVTGMPRLEARLNGNRPLTPQQEQRFSSLLLSRTRREPLQYLLGEQCFFGLDLAVDPRVLIPRQETETLCELGLSHLLALPRPSALDLCTGSGAIAVTLKHACPSASVTGTDLSEDALGVAGSNAERNRVSVRFLPGDLFLPVENERFDLILSNPPYIPSGECGALQPEVLYEPRMALDGGPDGLSFYRRIVAEAPAHLTASGMLAMETGDGQARTVAELLCQSGRYREIRIHRDLYGHERVTSALAAAGPT